MGQEGPRTAGKEKTPDQGADCALLHATSNDYPDYAVDGHIHVTCTISKCTVTLHGRQRHTVHVDTMIALSELCWAVTTGRLDDSSCKLRIFLIGVNQSHCC